MTSRKNKTLFTDEFLNVFNSINLQSLFIYENAINLAVYFNSDKLNRFLSNINAYDAGLTESVTYERLILSVPVKEGILGLPVYSKYKPSGQFNLEFLKHIYNASTDLESFTNTTQDEIYLDVSFIDFYSMSIAHFLIELYKSPITVAKFKSICKSISTAIKNKAFILNFTSDTDNFELVRCKYINICDYYGEDISDFEDSSFIAKVTSTSFALANTNYKIYCSLSYVPYEEHYSSLLQEENESISNYVFPTSSPFLIPYSIPEYFNKLSSNSAFLSSCQESTNDAPAQLVTGAIDSLFSLDLSGEIASPTQVSPITFTPISNLSDVYSKSFGINLFGSYINFFMNFNGKSRSVCSADSSTVYFSDLHVSNFFGNLSEAIIEKAKVMGLYRDLNNKANPLSLSKTYLIDPSYNYSVYSLGRGTTRALPFSPYIFFKQSLYGKNSLNYSAVSTFTSIGTTNNTKNYYVRSLDLNILFPLYTYALDVKTNPPSTDDECVFTTKAKSLNDSKMNFIVDHAFKYSDSVEVNLLAYFYYVLKDSGNQESMHLITDLFDLNP